MPKLKLPFMLSTCKLQAHEIRALQKKLSKLRIQTQKRKQFVEDHRDIYKLPKMLTMKNLREYDRLLKAIDIIDKFQFNMIN